MWFNGSSRVINYLKGMEQRIMATIQDLETSVTNLTNRVTALQQEAQTVNTAVQAEITRVNAVIAQLQTGENPALDSIVAELQTASTNLDAVTGGLQTTEQAANAEEPAPPAPAQ